MTRTRDQVRGRRQRARRAVFVFAMALFAASAGAFAQQPPPRPPDGFVPVESLPEKDEIPAAPLVIGAYAVAWIAVFGYLWSIWQRLGRVERDIAEVSRRVEAGPRR
jgi:CcmD family protein